MYYPNVIETTGRGSKAWDLPTKLLNDRIIYFGSDVNPDTANYTIMQLLWLNADNPDEPIDLYINSPGGSVYDGLATNKTMEEEKPPILGTWNRLYAFVLVLHAILIVLFYLFTLKHQ